MVKHEVFGIFSKTALRIFLIFYQNAKLHSTFQPTKTCLQKNKKNRFSFRSYFKSKMHRGSLLNDPLLYVLYLAQKLLAFVETSRK